MRLTLQHLLYLSLSFFLSFFHNLSRSLSLSLFYSHSVSISLCIAPRAALSSGTIVRSGCYFPLELASIDSASDSPVKAIDGFFFPPKMMTFNIFNSILSGWQWFYPFIWLFIGNYSIKCLVVSFKNWFKKNASHLALKTWDYSNYSLNLSLNVNTTVYSNSKCCC